MTKFTEYLERNSAGIRCAKCKYKLASKFREWKKSAKVAEFPLRKAGPLMSRTRKFILREFYCPGCATLLEVEMTRKNEPFIIDDVLNM
jgi:acetone carboxylase gamma subunit